VVTLHCPAANVHALANALRDKGAETVSVLAPEYVFTRENALYARLEAGIAGLPV
jgi:ATP phosphoribosyltransferase